MRPAIILVGFGLAVSACAKPAPNVQAHMLTAEQAAAAAGEQPTRNESVFMDVLPPPDWMSTDWVVSSPD